jgi:peroxidase
MGAPRINIVVLSILVFVIACVQTSSAQLSKGFYGNTCPNVEQLVRSAVELKFQQTFVTAPATLRLFFHDCFVRVCLNQSFCFQLCFHNDFIPQSI